MTGIFLLSIAAIVNLIFIVGGWVVTALTLERLDEGLSSVEDSCGLLEERAVCCEKDILVLQTSLKMNKESIEND